MREVVAGHGASKGCTECYPDIGAWDLLDGLPRHGDPFLTIGDTFERNGDVSGQVVQGGKW